MVIWMEKWILSRNLYKSVCHVCGSRKERISFLWTPDNKRDRSILENHSQGLRTEIVVSHLLILRRLAHLTNHRN